jgi:hypothetical protein
MFSVQELLDLTYCLNNVSKNLAGELIPVDQERRACEDPTCETLVTQHVLVVEVSSHECDSEIGRGLDGRLVVRDLTHVFTDADPRLRGIHTGTFAWTSALGRLQGVLSGTTNAGTHREPPFKDCQRCHEPGVMEGQLSGAFQRVTEPRLENCRVEAAYRIRFDPTEQGGRGAVSGTLEGSLVCPCAKSDCIDLGQLPTGIAHPNPLAYGGTLIDVRDHTGAGVLSNLVLTFFDSGGSPFTGLLLGYTAEITLAHSTSMAELTVFTGADLAKFEAVDTGGAVVGAAAMTVTHMAEIVSLAGTSPFTTIRAHSPSSEVLLQRLCLVR